MSPRPAADVLLLGPANYRTTPWKNGGGETTEIARRDWPGGTAELAWRLSMAPIVADGPFSRYPGIDRTTTIVAGAGLDMHLPGGAVLALEPLQPRTFDGGLAAEGRLRGGPVRAFNVMVARGAWQARVWVAGEGRGPLEGDDLPRGVLMIHALAEAWRWHGVSGDGVRLAAGETLLHEPATAWRLAARSPGALALVAEVVPLG